MEKVQYAWERDAKTGLLLYGVGDSVTDLWTPEMSDDSQENLVRLLDQLFTQGNKIAVYLYINASYRCQLCQTSEDVFAFWFGDDRPRVAGLISDYNRITDDLIRPVIEEKLSIQSLAIFEDLT
jgi:hypothetical protein